MDAKGLSVYLDTSVVGGYFDREFQDDTRALWRLRRKGRLRFVTSQLVFQEIARARERVRTLMRSTFAPSDVLERTAQVEVLAQAYLTHRVVSMAFVDDARHVAICAVAGVKFLVSWNFTHLVNPRRETGFNAVNSLQGYPSLRIVAPTYLVHGHEEEL